MQRKPVTQKPSMLLYIHGFNSSPGSHKATILSCYCRTYHPKVKVVIPQLPCFPVESARMLASLVEEYQDRYRIGLVGSSLGGYLSIWLSSVFDLKAAVINPAIRPYELLIDFLGEQINPYTQERYWLAAHHVDELKSLDVTEIKKPEQLLLLQQTGDEILDYRQAVDKLRQSRQIVEEGGDHSFIGFERYAQTVIQFLDLY